MLQIDAPPVAKFLATPVIGRAPSEQWCSRTFGRSGRWSNLPPFRLRFWKLESQRSNVIAQDTEDRYALQLKCFVFIARKHI